MGNLDGKVALVTGAGGMRGVGRATALKLAAQGADLAITDVRRDASDLPPAELRQDWHSIDSVSDEVEALGRRCLPRYADLGVSDLTGANYAAKYPACASPNTRGRPSSTWNLRKKSRSLKDRTSQDRQLQNSGKITS